MSEIVTNPSEVREIERIAREAIEPKPFKAEGYKDMIALPENLTLYDLDDFRDLPERIKRTVECTDITTLNRYWDKFADQYAELYADLDRLQICARLDEHRVFPSQVTDEATSVSPQWGDHKAVYNCPKSKEWIEWEMNDGNQMTQDEFGIFLEDRAQEVVKPDAPDLIALAAHFVVKQDVVYSKAVRLQDGNVALTYNETNEAGGSIEVPKELVIGVAPFHNGVKYEVRARFRYRLTGGSLKMWYELIEPHRFIEDAFNGVVAEVEAHTERPVSRVVMGTL